MIKGEEVDKLGQDMKTLFHHLLRSKFSDPSQIPLYNYEKPAQNISINSSLGLSLYYKKEMTPFYDKPKNEKPDTFLFFLTEIRTGDLIAFGEFPANKPGSISPKIGTDNPPNMKFVQELLQTYVSNTLNQIKEDNNSAQVVAQRMFDIRAKSTSQTTSKNSI